MTILVAFTIGMVWWVCAWALGVKSFDAFMVTALIVVVGDGPDRGERAMQDACPAPCDGQARRAPAHGPSYRQTPVG